MNEFNAFRLITGLFPHHFLELETYCLEIDFSLGELGEWPPVSKLPLPLG